MSSSSLNPDILRLASQRSPPPSLPSTRTAPPLSAASRGGPPPPKALAFGTPRWRRRHPQPLSTRIAATGEDPMDFPSFFELEDEGPGADDAYAVPSSDSEESDGELFMNPIGDVDLPTGRGHLEAPDGAFTVAAHRLSSIPRGQSKNRSQQGVMNTIGLVAFLAIFLLYVDWCSWRIIRLPLEPFYLTHPFLMSSFLSAFAGCVFGPIADIMKIHRYRRKEGHIKHSCKRPIPTMGGLFLVPIGILIARNRTSHSSEVNGAALVTLAFAAIGLVHDTSEFLGDPSWKLPGWIRFLMQVAIGTCFSLWLNSASVSTPYSMKLLIPLPPPLGLVSMGQYYLVFTVICFAAMGTGVYIGDDFDGFAGGVAALAFVGSSVAALPICPELAIFGASMSGSCIGFLFHNRYKASIYMGHIGSFALGGALAAIAACTGMFLPMLISTTIFLLELFSVIFQVPFLMAMKHSYGTNKRALRVAPLHRYLKLWGLKEPYVVAGAYIASCFLALFAGYIGLISA